MVSVRLAAGAPRSISLPAPKPTLPLALCDRVVVPFSVTVSVVVVRDWLTSVSVVEVPPTSSPAPSFSATPGPTARFAPAWRLTPASMLTWVMVRNGRGIGPCGGSTGRTKGAELGAAPVPVGGDEVVHPAVVRPLPAR